MKTVYSYDPETGAYLGETEADESPLEPGVYHIPAYATETPPPAHRDGYVSVFNGDRWKQIAVPKVEAAPEEVEVDPRSLMIVSRFQARAALYKTGLLDRVEEMMRDPNVDPIARLAWQDAATFSRLSSFVITLGSALGLNDYELDVLFTEASTITA